MSSEADSVQSSQDSCQALGGLANSAVVRVFLFTDIEGSTALWEKAGRAFRTALDQHDRLVRAEAARHGGQELTESGDGFLIAFGEPSKAVDCAVDVQRAVAAAQWPEVVGSIRVRMGLHIGSVEPRGEEYRGVAINRTARILAAGHGGQVICSAAVADSLNGNHELVELGVFRLRGLPGPERLLQVCWPDMERREFPPPNALPAFTNNLPQSFTRFFGRGEEIGRLRLILLAHEEKTATGGVAGGLLVTLTGPGGTGKTRLSLAVAESLLRSFSHAVWFVPLADLVDASLLPVKLRDTLQLKPDAAADPLEQVIAALCQQPVLLVLDNFEQLGDAGVGVMRTLLARVPSLRCLVTSRQRLALAGEREFAVGPLAIPLASGAPEQLVEFDSVQLFVDRAQAVRSDFALTTRNARAVAELCRRLEGVPLALELAAARAHVATAQEIVDALGRRLDAFAAQNPDVPARHRTLRAAIDWSYDFLPAPLRQFLANLSVFRGGWNLEAAECVATPEGLAGVSASVLRALGELRAGSLVAAEERGKGMRFRMLETLRCYAEERLHESNAALIVRGKHLHYFAGFADRADRALPGGEQVEQLDALEIEHDNLRAALAAPDLCDTRLRMAADLVVLWRVRGYHAEGRGWLQRLRVECTDASPLAVAAADNAMGILAWSGGDLAAARDAFEKTLQYFRSVDDARNIAGALTNLAFVTSSMGELARARTYAEEGVEIFERLPFEGKKAQALSNLAGIALAQKDYPAVRAAAEKAIPIQRALDDKLSLGVSLQNLSGALLAEDRIAEAEEALRESVTLRRELQDRAGAASLFYTLAEVALHSGRYEEAATWLGASEKASVVFQTPHSPQLLEGRLRHLELLSRNLNKLTLEAAWERGGQIPPNWFGSGEEILHKN